MMQEWQSGPYQFPTLAEHHTVAWSLLKGCLQHWKESVSRISRNYRIVPPEKSAEFHGLIKMMYCAQTAEEFEQIKGLIMVNFPNTSDWLHWWSRTGHAEILFPALRRGQSSLQHVQGFTTLIMGELN